MAQDPTFSAAVTERHSETEAVHTAPLDQGNEVCIGPVHVALTVELGRAAQERIVLDGDRDRSWLTSP